jgi:hypothetical protein
VRRRRDRSLPHLSILISLGSQHRSPAVQTLYTHLENEQIVVFPDAATEEERAAAIKDKHTDLMNYFARPLGRKFDNLTYIEYYEKYTVNKRQPGKPPPTGTLQDKYGNVVKRRVKRNSSIARISFLAPTNGDVYYLSCCCSIRPPVHSVSCWKKRTGQHMRSTKTRHVRRDRRRIQISTVGS